MELKTSISEKKRAIGITWGSVSGFQPFRDLGAIPYESTLERDFVIRAAHNPDVVSVESQPFTIQYENKDGFLRSYTPDYKVTYRDRTGDFRKNEIFEVKPERKLKEQLHEWKPKYLAAINYCKYNDFVFKLIHEHKIRDQRWENAMQFSRVRGIEYSQDNYEKVIVQLRQDQISTVDELAENCFSKEWINWGKSLICALIDQCEIYYDANHPFTTSSKIWAPAND